jgi:Conserved hypothetical protein (DUF2461)
VEPRVSDSIMRINRDIRFSKDKSPYKDHLDLWFWTGDREGWDASGFFSASCAGGPPRFSIGVSTDARIPRLLGRWVVLVHAPPARQPIRPRPLTRLWAVGRQVVDDR